MPVAICYVAHRSALMFPFLCIWIVLYGGPYSVLRFVFGCMLFAMFSDFIGFTAVMVILFGTRTSGDTILCVAGLIKHFSDKSKFVFTCYTNKMSSIQNCTENINK